MTTYSKFVLMAARNYNNNSNKNCCYSYRRRCRPTAAAVTSIFATTTKREIVTRSLPLTAGSSSSSSSSSTVFMSPFILNQQPNQQLQHNYQHQNHQQQQQQQQYSVVVEICNTNEKLATRTNTTPIQHRHRHRHRQAHTYTTGSSSQPPHRLVVIPSSSSSSRNKNSRPKSPASGWKKPIVSSSSPFLSSSSSSSLAAVSSSSSSSSSTNSNSDSDTNSDTDTNSKATITTTIDGENTDTNTNTKTNTASSNSNSNNNSSSNMVGVDMEELLKLALNKVTPLSLKDMYKYAIVDVDNPEQRIRNAQFLHNELPVRIAQRAVDLLTLPHGLNEIPAVLQVAHVYLLYLEKFQDCPIPTDVQSEDSFTDMLQSMILERSSIPNAIARGVDAWIDERSFNNISDDDDTNDDDDQQRKKRYAEMEDALYRFFTARVGLRFLTEHHILSSPIRIANKLEEDLSRTKNDTHNTTIQPKSINGSSSDNSNENNSFLGCIQPNCCPSLEVRKVVEAVKKQTMDYYGDGVCPEIQIVDGDIHGGVSERKNNFTYVPHHLHYMVGELLKNSCRATVKRHIEHGLPGESIPPIKIVIVKGAEDVTIKIADRGGGIPRSKMSHIWQFAHSTADKDEIENETDFGVDEITGAAIRGFGLPLARIYARYLGGELTLKSLEGYGVDAYLHLPRLGDSCENLPLPVEFSPSNLNSNPLRTMDQTQLDESF